MKEETLRLINGNNQIYKIGLPGIVILDKMNDVAFNHMEENTGLKFNEYFAGYEAQPIHSNQIVRLFLTYNFETEYFNNVDIKNTLFLRFKGEK